MQPSPWEPTRLARMSSWMVRRMTIAGIEWLRHQNGKPRCFRSAETARAAIAKATGNAS